MIVKEIIKRKNVKELSDSFNSNEPDELKDFSDLDKLEKDSAYSNHSDSEISKNESTVDDKKSDDKKSDDKKSDDKKSDDTKN